MKINVKLDTGAYCPQKAHKHDAGYDLFVPLGQNLVLRPHDSVTIPTGVHVAIPHGYYMSVENRSGLNFKEYVTLHGCGIIDSGYTGSIGVKLYNDSGEIKTFKGGDRIAQLIIHPYTEDVEFVLVDELDDTDRGEKGFGSTGR